MFSLVALKKVEELEHKSQVVRVSQVLSTLPKSALLSRWFSELPRVRFVMEGNFCLDRENYNHFGGFLVLLDHIQQLSNAGYYMVGSFLEMFRKDSERFSHFRRVAWFAVSLYHGFITFCTALAKI